MGRHVAMTPALQAPLLELIRKGISLRLASAHGLPSYSLVKRYCAENAAFSGELRAAQIEVRSRINERFAAQTEARCRAAISRVVQLTEAGDSCSAICKSLRIGNSTLRSFLKNNPLEARRVADARSRKQRKAARRLFTAEHYGESLRLFADTVDRQAEDFSPVGLPGYRAMQSLAFRDREFAARLAEARRARISRICETGVQLPTANRSRSRSFAVFGAAARMRLLKLIRAGATLGDALSHPGMPSEQTVRYYREIDSDFDRALKAARYSPKRKIKKTKKKSYYMRQNRALRGQLDPDQLYRAAEAAVSRHHLLPHVRQDVMSDLAEAILRGDFGLEDVGEYVADFISDHNRRSETFKSSSLDATMSDDSDMTFLDRLSTDDYFFAE